MLKNELAPWQSQGRWYHAFVESDGIDYTLTVSDLEDAEIETPDGESPVSALKFPVGYRIVGIQSDIHGDALTDTDYAGGKRIYSDGAQGVILPPVALFDFMAIWVFAYLEQ